MPYTLGPGTVEHYLEMAESGFPEIEGQTVLVGRSAGGEYRVFDRLTFHGGAGSTLERRVFSEQSIREALTAAGFPIVRFDAKGNRDFGVVFAHPCSLPVIAARGPFALSAGGIMELVEQLSAARILLTVAKSMAKIRPAHRPRAFA